MSNNFDFGNTNSVTPLSGPKITVYGPQGAVPINPPRFPTAYLTAPPYDTNNNITPTNGPKITVYKSLDTPKFPFTYIGTDAINNIGLFGQVIPNNGPKISVYEHDMGILVFSYDFTGSDPDPSLNNLPIITGTALTIYTKTSTISGQTKTVTVSIKYTDNGSDFGLSFKNCYSFYNDNTTTLTITTLTDIPLSRNGNQFSNLTKVTNLFSSNTVIPIILPNTSLSNCFNGCATFNSNISGWKIPSSVTDMSYMFSGCSAFNNGLDSGTSPTGFSFFNLSNTTLTNMSYMFNGCSAFNQRLNLWIIPSSVTDMSNMFNGCSKFNQVIGVNWVMPKLIKNLSNMFNGCTVFNNGAPSGSNITGFTYFNLSSVNTDLKDLSGMFSKCINFNVNINSWIIPSNVTDMSNMFNGCSKFNTSLLTSNPSTWRIPPSVTDLSNMFTDCIIFNFGKSLNTPSDFAYLMISSSSTNERNLSGMFSGCTNFNQNISSWNTTNVTDMSSMFSGCVNFNNGDFTNAVSKPLTSWTTTNVTDMSSMFFKCMKFNQNIANWITTNVKDMSYMFSGGWEDDISLQKIMIFNGDISSWNTENVTNMTQMFTKCQSFNKQVGNWKTGKVTLMDLMFTQCINFNNGDTTDAKSKPFSTTNWITTNVTNMNGMFFGCSKFNQDITSWDTRKVVNISNIFYGALIFNNGDLVNGQNKLMTKSYTTPAVYTSWNFTMTFTTDTLGNPVTNWHGGGCTLIKNNAPTQLQSAPYW
jgi:surface protein